VSGQACSEAAQLAPALLLPKQGQNAHWLFAGPVLGSIFFNFNLKKKVSKQTAGQSNCLIPGNSPALLG